MNERIEKLTELTLGGKMYAQPKKTEFDRRDIFLSREQMESKRLCEFIMNQAPGAQGRLLEKSGAKARARKPSMFVCSAVCLDIACGE